MEQSATGPNGSLAHVIMNTEGLYQGNLAAYFKAVFLEARNVNLPAHNFRHMTHVTYLCYDACHFYQHEEGMTSLEMRKLLIAALFHDFDHCGMAGDDDLNIIRAIRGLKRHLQPEDEMHFDEIAALIRVTEYPPKETLVERPLCARILHDADLAQALSPAWIQQIILGFSREWGKTPLEVLRMQEQFLGNLRFSTEWARRKFPADVVEAKIEEGRDLLAILEHV